MAGAKRPFAQPKPGKIVRYSESASARPHLVHRRHPMPCLFLATGIGHGLPLVTSDAKIQAWKGIPVVW